MNREEYDFNKWLGAYSVAEFDSPQFDSESALVLSANTGFVSDGNMGIYSPSFNISHSIVKLNLRRLSDGLESKFEFKEKIEKIIKFVDNAKKGENLKYFENRVLNVVYGPNEGEILRVGLTKLDLKDWTNEYVSLSNETAESEKKLTRAVWLGSSFFGEKTMENPPKKDYAIVRSADIVPVENSEDDSIALIKINVERFSDGLESVFETEESIKEIRRFIGFVNKNEPVNNLGNYLKGKIVDVKYYPHESGEILRLNLNVHALYK